MSADQQTEGGWAFPNTGSRAKAHYFPKAVLLEPSLCGRWAYNGLRIDGGLDSPQSLDDCRQCRRQVAGLQAEGART